MYRGVHGTERSAGPGTQYLILNIVFLSFYTKLWLQHSFKALQRCCMIQQGGADRERYGIRAATEEEMDRACEGRVWCLCVYALFPGVHPG